MEEMACVNFSPHDMMHLRLDYFFRGLKFGMREGKTLSALISAEFSRINKNKKSGIPHSGTLLLSF
jgi:hypothetical protein